MKQDTLIALGVVTAAVVVSLVVGVKEQQRQNREDAALEAELFDRLNEILKADLDVTTQGMDGLRAAIATMSKVGCIRLRTLSFHDKARADRVKQEIDRCFEEHKAFKTAKQTRTV